MKRILFFISAFALLLTACDGDQGPPGPPGFDGPQGEPGAIIASSAFEITVDFTAGNSYEFIEPYGFEVLDSDVTLVYIQWETDNGNSIWRLLPQTTYFDNGVLTYNYDFTQTDVRLFLDGTVDFATLDNVWTQSQLFRVVVVPADKVDGVDINNLNDVMEIGNINEFNIR